jgi:hypothetical protein
MEKIMDRMADPAHGRWYQDGKARIVQPKPSFFDTVNEKDLVDLFNQHPDDSFKLHLP